MRNRTCTVLATVLGVAFAISFVATPSSAQLIFQENFEGNDTNYDFGDESYAGPDEGDWAPGIWGLNSAGDPIGLAQAAPAKRAAILWDHEAFEDDFTADSLETWVGLVDWATGVADAGARATERVAFYGGYLEESVGIVKDALEGAGYADANLTEVFDPLEISPDDFDVVIHSSVLASTAFSNLAVPLISFSASDHDDSAIAGIGQRILTDGEVVLEIPEEFRNHPALGGKGVNGTIDWTSSDLVNLQGIGKTHAGGKAIAFWENPATGDPSPAIFVIEEGDALLGSWSPEPEGELYVVGSALNKHGLAGEVALVVGPIDVSGQSDLNLTVALAATAADFENGDYLFIEASVDGEVTIIDEFFGVDEAHDPSNESGCLKGLSNGGEPGDVGDICLPDKFADFTFKLPEGDSLELTFRALNTWGNEIIGIDNIRVHSGSLGPDCDFDGDGTLGLGDVDALREGIMGGGNEAKFDVNGDGAISADDLKFFVTDASKLNTWIGDANLDGEFSSSDFVAVFEAGLFETGNAATWATGDWNADGVFGSGDFVAAFQDGGFELGPKGQAVASVPEPASFGLALMAALGLMLRRRRTI